MSKLNLITDVEILDYAYVLSNAHVLKNVTGSVRNKSMLDYILSEANQNSDNIYCLCAYYMVEICNFSPFHGINTAMSVSIPRIVVSINQDYYFTGNDEKVKEIVQEIQNRRVSLSQVESALHMLIVPKQELLDRMMIEKVFNKLEPFILENKESFLEMG